MSKNLENIFIEILSDGTKVWYKNDIIHRDDDLPSIEYANGAKCWHQNGQLHRIGKPAMIQDDGIQYWYKFGKLHREDGPAIEFVDGPPIKFALNDKELDYDLCKNTDTFKRIVAKLLPFL